MEAAAAVIPDARLLMIVDQDHGVPPDVVGPVLADFFLGSGA